MSDQRTLLLIEDEPEQREVLAMMFESEGYTVLAAESAELGLELLRNNSAQLIVCDVKLTGMDGFTFYDTVRKEPHLREVPFMFITGYNDPASIAHVTSLGSAAYITKPYNLEELMKLVRTKIGA